MIDDEDDENERLLFSLGAKERKRKTTEFTPNPIKIKEEQKSFQFRALVRIYKQFYFDHISKYKSRKTETGHN
jgi:hypothetical protein